MQNYRLHGQSPYSVVVVHGGPGAPGDMAAVARELASDGSGILEPLQTADSMDGQIRELHQVIQAQAQTLATVIGHSWGAMLAFMLAAYDPQIVQKLILVGSAVFDPDSAVNISETRLKRLNPQQRQLAQQLRQQYKDPTADQVTALRAYAELIMIADHVDPISLNTETIALQPDINQKVWGEAAAYRASGDLLRQASKITCPVVAIHGDYDPHPIAGVRDPLSGILADFRLIVLEQCGHYPWLERGARDLFFDVLRAEIEG